MPGSERADQLTMDILTVIPAFALTLLRRSPGVVCRPTATRTAMETVMRALPLIMTWVQIGVPLTVSYGQAHERPRHLADVGRRCRRRPRPRPQSYRITALASPQKSHRSGMPTVTPTKSPRTKRHSPAYGDTAANMVTVIVTSHYAARTG